MFIKKKRWQALLKRVADLEGQVQSQREKRKEYELLMTKEGSTN